MELIASFIPFFYLTVDIEPHMLYTKYVDRRWGMLNKFVQSKMREIEAKLQEEDMSLEKAQECCNQLAREILALKHKLNITKSVQ